MKENRKKSLELESKAHGKKKHTELSVEKINIRCRTCFVIDGYAPNETKCKHCGSRLFLVDRY